MFDNFAKKLVCGEGCFKKVRISCLQNKQQYKKKIEKQPDMRSTLIQKSSIIKLIASAGIN